MSIQTPLNSTAYKKQHLLCTVHAIITKEQPKTIEERTQKDSIGPIPITTYSCSTTGQSTAMFLYFLLLSVALSIPFGLFPFSSQW